MLGKNEELIHRGAWRKEDYNYPEWEEKANTFLAKLPGNWDSHHVTFGLFVLVMFFAMSETITWYLVPVYWLGFFYVRNIGMHIIFKKKPLWGYLWKI